MFEKLIYCKIKEKKYPLVNGIYKNMKVENKKEYIQECEKKYNQQIDYLIQDIINKNISIVLLSGPSGSGKTTTAKRLVEGLKNKNVESVYLSMDNWYKTRKTFVLPLDEKGNPDYESPDCVDIERLNQDINRLLNKEKVQIPYFDFVTETQMFDGDVLQLKDKNSVIVIEGLHALNPYVKIDKKYNVYKVYVCPQDYNMLENVMLKQENLRLYRRISRDLLSRGRTKDKTIDMFDSVCRGERLYLQPYLKYVDFKIDSLIEYEIYIHKNFLHNFEVLKFVDEVDITKEDIPEGSILNEFFKK